MSYYRNGQYAGVQNGEGGSHEAQYKPQVNGYAAKPQMKNASRGNGKEKKSSTQRRCDRIFELMLKEICGGDVDKLAYCFEAFVQSKDPQRFRSKITNSHTNSSQSHTAHISYQNHHQPQHSQRGRRTRTHATTALTTTARGAKASAAATPANRYDYDSGRIDTKKNKYTPQTNNYMSSPTTLDTSPPVSRSMSRPRRNVQASKDVRRSTYSRSHTNSKRRSKSMSRSMSLGTSTSNIASRAHSTTQSQSILTTPNNYTTRSRTMTSFSSYTTDRRDSVNVARASSVTNKRLAELQRAMRVYRNNPSPQTRRRLERAKAAVEGKQVQARPTSLNPTGAIVGVENAPIKSR
mmetsp:Transcript_11014/g.20262  ORF Transcript_11014/g.20262 Transcript_11014/m.20262 type:complete len:350 (-) Transcript_11014:156-1205(-)